MRSIEGDPRPWHPDTREPHGERKRNSRCRSRSSRDSRSCCRARLSAVHFRRGRCRRERETPSLAPRDRSSGSSRETDTSCSSSRRIDPTNRARGFAPKMTNPVFFARRRPRSPAIHPPVSPCSVTVTAITRKMRARSSVPPFDPGGTSKTLREERRDSRRYDASRRQPTHEQFLAEIQIRAGGPEEDVERPHDEHQQSYRQQPHRAEISQLLQADVGGQEHKEQRDHQNRQLLLELAELTQNIDVHVADRQAPRRSPRRCHSPGREHYSPGRAPGRPRG